ncbi:hypothetical protein [Zhaonella formicivorans]|uniref:hypothetical protein n=1 Tax=Zhaonella formicivorans TaxID=2528593 RepID=UPI0010E41C97|nr:hypothetical protein [Zhaonella formicivorans]
MAKLLFRFIKQGTGAKHGAPIHIALVNKDDVVSSGLNTLEAIEVIARHINGPVAINIFDMNAVTTTSDGIAVEGAIITMAAGDIGKVHLEFGVLHMAEIEVTPELVETEPHLKQIIKYYPHRKLFRGPDPAKKLIPVHNAVMTGKAINNNSATEIMNAVTMEEMLLPILGQLQIMNDGDVLLGITGEVVSVGIGMTVAEKFGRVFPFPTFYPGETAHKSGEYAKTLKAHIPCIVAPKEVLAKYIIMALEAGMVPGLHLGCSPAVLAVASALGTEIAFDNITPEARIELESVGIDLTALTAKNTLLTREEVIAKADQIIPGVVNPQRVAASEIVEKISIKL